LTFDVLKLLEQEGYIKDGEDNILHAEKAFFAARVMQWIRDKVQTDPDFNLTAYLKMLMYYKTDLADLKFTEDGSKLVYRMRNNDKEVQDIVNSLIKSTSKSRQESPPKENGEESTNTTEGADGTRDP